MTRIVKIGTRKSKLALWQSNHVAKLIGEKIPDTTVELKEIITRGDKNLDVSLPSIGGKGLFTAELEEELLLSTMNIAVHSLKDLPTELEENLQFTLAAIISRVAYRDVLISRGNLALHDLPHGAVIGTSSPRRSSQLKRIRNDLVMRDIRGNVDTRIRKVRRRAV